MTLEYRSDSYLDQQYPIFAAIILETTCSNVPSNASHLMLLFLS